MFSAQIFSGQTLYQRREQFSACIGIAALALMLSPVLKYTPTAKPSNDEVMLQVVIESPPVLPSEPLPAQPATTNTPAETTKPVATSTPMPTPAPSPIPVTASQTVPSPAQPSPPVVVPPSVATKESVTAPVEAKPAAKSNVNEDANYTARLNASVEARKKYPTSREASLQRPVGTVTVAITLSREGKVIDSEVVRTSNSMILDEEALKLIKRGNYPAFPDEAFHGEAQHRFLLKINYAFNPD